MFIFIKVLDQLIRSNFLKLNSIIDSSRDFCLDSNRNYLPDNAIMTVSVFLKTFFSTTKKCVKYFELGLTLKVSLRMNHKNTNKLMRYRLGKFLYCIYCHFISFFFCKKNYILQQKYSICI